MLLQQPFHPPQIATASPVPCNFLALPYPSSSGLASCSRVPYNWWVSVPGSSRQCPLKTFSIEEQFWSATCQPGTSDEAHLSASFPCATPTCPTGPAGGDSPQWQHGTRANAQPPLAPPLACDLSSGWDFQVGISKSSSHGHFARTAKSIDFGP